MTDGWRSEEERGGAAMDGMERRSGRPKYEVECANQPLQGVGQGPRKIPPGCFVGAGPVSGGGERSFKRQKQDRLHEPACDKATADGYTGAGTPLGAASGARTAAGAGTRRRWRGGPSYA